ncbi:unnamed protein product [Ixodes pacificus]
MCRTLENRLTKLPHRITPNSSNRRLLASIKGGSPSPRRMMLIERWFCSCGAYIACFTRLAPSKKLAAALSVLTRLLTAFVHNKNQYVQPFFFLFFFCLIFFLFTRQR